MFIQGQFCQGNAKVIFYLHVHVLLKGAQSNVGIKIIIAISLKHIKYL